MKRRASDRGRYAPLAAALLALCLLGPGATADPAPSVIVLSWDGVRHDFPDRGEFPALARMQREGLRAERLVPVFPANTFPNHVSLATGTYPDVHGIVDNRFLDSERGEYDYEDDASWIEAEPLWIAAERQGVRSAVFFWVGSQTDWRGARASYRIAPFSSSVGEAEKVDQILEWLALPAPERPRLILSWWHGVDGVAHRKGPDHPDVAAALAEQDAQLGRLLAELDARDAWPHTTLIVVSDHGMTEVNERIEVEPVLERAGVAADVRLWSSAAHVYLAEKDPATLARAEAALGDLAHVRVHRREAFPAELRFAYPQRIGDLVLLTDPPRTFQRGTALQQAAAAVARSLGWQVGMHGYAPSHPDMGAVFFALGRGVPRGKRVGPIRAVDVAPTVAALLGMEAPRQSEGSPTAWVAHATRR